MKRIMLTIIFVIPSLISFAGCALINPTNPYPDVTRTQVQTESRAVSRSKIDTENKSITLSDAIGIALENNPSVAAARHETDAASARHAQAFARALPKIDATGGYTHDMDDQRLIPAHYNGEPGVFGDDIYSAEMVLTQPLFTGGRLINGISAAKLLEQAAVHRLSRTREELVFNVSSTFYTILAQREIVGALKFSKKALDEHLKQVNNLIANKKASRVDRLRIKVRIADIVQRLTLAENMLSIQKRVLTNLMGASDTRGALTITGDLNKGPSGPVDMDRNINMAFKLRTDYMAARAALEATAKKVDAARAGHWPSISLQGSYGERWSDDPSVYPPGTNASDDMGRIGVFVNIPIFESGLISARVREERAALYAAGEKLRALELGIRLDVQTAVLNIDTDIKRIHTTEKAIDQAKESLRIERKKYNYGKGSITDVLDAQSSMLDSQTNYYKALVDYNTALAQLRLATGVIK